MMVSVASYNRETCKGVIQFIRQPGDRERQAFLEQASRFLCKQRGNEDLIVTVVTPGQPSRISTLPNHRSMIQA